MNLIYENHLYIVKRILRLKPRNRSKAAKAATGQTPRLKAGACASLSGQNVGGSFTLNSVSPLMMLQMSLPPLFISHPLCDYSLSLSTNSIAISRIH